MKKFTLILVITLLTLTVSIYGEKIAELPELGKPTLLTISKDSIYVSDGTTIHIYSTKNYKYLGKFGKKGQGPEEMTSAPMQDPMVYLHKDQLVINSIGKVSFHDKKGKYIKEIKPQLPFPMRNMIQPIDGKFTGLSFGRKDKSTIINVSLFSKDMAVEKSHLIMPVNNKRVELPYPAPIIFVHNKRIFAGSDKGFTINIFDSKLNKTGNISIADYKKEKISQTFKERVLNAFKELIPDKTQFEAIKKNIKFREFFPPYQNFYIDGTRLYALTYSTDGEKNEFCVFDIESKKFIKKVMVPFQFIGMIPAATAIKDNKLYQIIENDDDEVWELHSVKIL